jgi:hypothetical protein
MQLFRYANMIDWCLTTSNFIISWRYFVITYSVLFLIDSCVLHWYNPEVIIL